MKNCYYMIRDPKRSYILLLAGWYDTNKHKIPSWNFKTLDKKQCNDLYHQNLRVKK